MYMYDHLSVPGRLSWEPFQIGKVGDAQNHFPYVVIIYAILHEIHLRNSYVVIMCVNSCRLVSR